MSYNIEVTALFEKQLKRLLKKFPSLKAEYFELIDLLKEEPKSGTPIGNNCYKIRLAIAFKGKGKSGGAGLSLTCKSFNSRCFYCRFTINPNRAI